MLLSVGLMEGDPGDLTKKVTFEQSPAGAAGAEGGVVGPPGGGGRKRSTEILSQEDARVW